MRSIARLIPSAEWASIAGMDARIDQLRAWLAAREESVDHVGVAELCGAVKRRLRPQHPERAERLGGKTTSQYVSELRENGIIEDCDNPFDGVRYVHNGNLSLPEATQLPS